MMAIHYVPLRPSGFHLLAGADSQPPDSKQLPFAGQVGQGARFNDGRCRVTTEAKLPPLARFGCSMVWRWISVYSQLRRL